MPATGVVTTGAAAEVAVVTTAKFVVRPFGAADELALTVIELASLSKTHIYQYIF